MRVEMDGDVEIIARVPFVAGAAFLRYRLFDIDLVIRKTLVYTVLTGLLALSFLGTVALLQNLLAAAGGQRSQLATVLSTLAIAALFSQPRRRARNSIYRRFYRQRYDAERALAEFNSVVREEVDHEALTGRMTALVKQILKPEKVSLWIRTR